jgi:hypothetical protein
MTTPRGRAEKMAGHVDRGDNVLRGLGLVIVLAVGSQLLAGRLRGEIALFVVTADGDLRVASAGKSPPVNAGDRLMALVGAG